MVSMQPDPFARDNPSVGGAVALAPDDVVRRLRWRSRRGLLENDLFLDRFFRQWEGRLTLEDHHGLGRLLDLTDNDLLDLLVGVRDPEGDLDLPEVRSVLAKLRSDQP